MADFDPTKEQWCWVPDSPGCGAVFGPHDTREEALADALEQLGPGASIMLGHPEEIKPEQYASFDLDALLGSMNDTAHDEHGGCLDEQVFYIVDMPAAQASLDYLLSAWAKQHVAVSLEWWATCDVPATTETTP